MKATTNWALDFPGLSPLLATLRKQLSNAEQIYLAAHAHLIQFQTRLNATGLPQPFWPQAMLQRFTRLQKLVSRAWATFHRALKAIRAVTCTRPAPAQTITEVAVTKNRKTIFPISASA